MKHLSLLVMTMVVGATSACSDDDGSDVPRGSAGTSAGTGGAGGNAGTGGAAGISGGGAGGTTPVPLPDPALPSNAATLTCPRVINGSLDTSDSTQTGRHSRVEPVSACGVEKAYPGNAADPSNPHLFDVYRFENPTNAPVCFSFTLSDATPGVVEVDAGLDAGADAAAPGSISADSGAQLDAGGDASVAPGPERYLTAYGTFYPTDLALEFLGDIGADLLAPQTMGITVPAGETVDVVVYGVLNAPLGAGPYTLSCSTQ